jgi:hypothetical protein
MIPVISKVHAVMYKSVHEVYMLTLLVLIGGALHWPFAW